MGTLGTCVKGEWGLLWPGFFKCREVPSPISNGHMGDMRDTLVLAATPKLGYMGQWNIEDTWHRGMVTPLAWLLGTQGSPKSSQSRDTRTHLPWSSAAGTPCVPIPRTREHQGTVGTPLSWSSAPADALGPNTWVMGTPGTCDSWEGGQFRGPWGYGDQGGPWGHLGTWGCPHGLTLLNSTGLKMSMRSEKSFWMLLSRWVSMGALGMVTPGQSGTWSQSHI